MKRYACLFAALCLVLLLATPVFAEPTAPDEPTTAIGETGELETTADEGYTEEIAAPIDTTLPDTTEEPPILYALDGEAGEDEALTLLTQENLTYCALGLGGLALLLSIVALIKTRKKKAAPNATGNYQKYF